NPVHPEFLAPLRSIEPPAARPWVTWIARMDELKDWRGVLRVGRELIDRVPEVELQIVGPALPPVPAAFLELVMDLGLQRHVRWWRAARHDVLPRLLDATRDSGGVFLSTSQGESFGMTI